MVIYMINNNWDIILKDEFSKDYFKKIINFLNEDTKIYRVFPEKKDIFNALKLTDFNDVKCVIIGQDPYHGYKQANGLAFSVNKGIKFPPSLRNIFLELKYDLFIDVPINGDLTKWAKEGVLLLNTVLTVRENCANSHSNIGWEMFTDRIIEILNESDRSICFILWGNHAKSKARLLTNKKHLILTGAHPSPLSSYKGFFNGKYFSKTNDFLIKTKQIPIDWKIDD